MSSVRQAYEILSDPEARAKYDNIRSMGEDRRYKGPQAFKPAFRTAEEVFCFVEFFGGGLAFKASPMYFGLTHKYTHTHTHTHTGVERHIRRR